ncbi:amino acid adenylation domain-containing protein, partial [Streptomyces sp. Ru87]|uniref:amino acid adenylation domain-containing protein n=1 Tax=Streptomyces sp. Ru87 TaxID=2044307 RepID=UPI000C01BCA9
MRPDPEWTAGPPRTAPGEGLHQTVARLARARPAAVALVAGDRRTTYEELDRTADAWAARLAADGVAPGDLVPVLLPRGTELVTALLAVLKTGAAYALLDPDWPARRLGDVLADLAPPLLVGAPDAAEHGLPVWSPPAGPAVPDPAFRPAAVPGSHPACVFFTSGTTGRPKGVLTPHRATARLFRPGGFARFGPGSVVPLAAPAPWDAFSLELWSVLLSGGTSLIVEDPYLSPAALRDGVTRHGADTVWLTSSLFNLAVDEDPDAFTGLRQVMTGGERLSPAHVRRFLRRHPGITLLNGYGPVESTVFATTHRITEADCERPDGIPLGLPVPGTGVHVLDGSRPCAAGETGEICLSGEGLALRYLGDAARTAEKFTVVRIDGAETRVYRTGDLGTVDPDGLLCFRGRADRQLKIRGHRVEPAEVERQLEQLLPGVRSCRVLARPDATGTTRELVAFCRPVVPGDPLPNAARVLRSALVSYQRPAAVVSVDTFPVTDRGKLDERALLALAPPAGHGGEPGAADAPPPGAGSGDAGRDAARGGSGAVTGGAASSDAGSGPRDATTAAVAEVFGTVLGRNGVPLDVPFVELGGTSLGAGRVCARLSRRLGRPVPVSRLHRHPTARALAHWLRTTTPPAAPAPDPAGPGPDPSDVPLSPLQ